MIQFSKFDFPQPVSLGDDEFNLLRKLIFNLSGINLPDHKKELVRARLFKRLKVLDLESFHEYYEYLISKDHDQQEQLEMLNAISTNKTEFFRENAHFEFLKNKAFSSFESHSVIRILSAGCSTGEEAYSIGITAWEYFGSKTSSSILIHACDINTEVLTHANEGVYSYDLVRSFSKDRLRLFFLQGVGDCNGLVKVKPELRSLILLKRHNITECLPYQFSFEIIFCRNVVIYFNRDTQFQVFKHLYNGLKPGGYLILGHSESLSFFKLPLRYIQPSVYQKPK